MKERRRTKDEGQRAKDKRPNPKPQIPTTSNQQPTTSDQPPTASHQIIGEKLKKINIRSGGLTFILVGQFRSYCSMRREKRLMKANKMIAPTNAMTNEGKLKLA